MDLTEILRAAVKHGASDVHIVPDRPPLFRINGTMRGLSAESFSREDTERIILGALREELDGPSIRRQSLIQPSEIEERAGQVIVVLTFLGPHLGRTAVGGLRCSGAVQST